MPIAEVSTWQVSVGEEPDTAMVTACNASWSPMPKRSLKSAEVYQLVPVPAMRSS